MKYSILCLALIVAGYSQPPQLAIKGDLSIKFNTRTGPDSERPVLGANDVYTLNVNVANSALFRGTINYRPFISRMAGSNQNGQVVFEVNCDVVNPANPAQTRNIGKLFGTAPVDKTNVYRFSDGNVKISVFGMGSAKGFESRFSGLAIGKPPASSGLAKIKQEAVRLVSSKGGAVTLTKYDKMTFENHVIPAGPVQIYPEATVSGTMFYDYGRMAWHFNNVTISYFQDGKRMADNLTGNIRWTESPARKSNGEGQYDFDIRVNEPPPTEAAVFAATTDEASFFASDDANPSLTGIMKYKDGMSNGTVLSSVVQIDLKGNKLTKQQLMHLFKLLFLSSLVPVNAE